MTMTSYELLLDIHALEEEMLAFERKYGLRPPVFMDLFESSHE